MSLLWNGDGDGSVEPHYEYEGFYPGSALDQISEMEPEGWDYQMTEAEYRHAKEQFKQRVIDQYGHETWDSYNYRARNTASRRRDGHGGGDAPVG